MPKRSQKSKSKRLTLRAKHKIIRKVKEHHKKKRRELKKSGKANKAPKDPGLPSQWPFKEELVKEFAFKRAQILADEQRRKEERKQARQAKKAAAMETDDNSQDIMALARLQASAANKQADFETRKRARLTEDFQSDKDNSKKAFYKEFKKVVELADVVIQVLDARDPLACRCVDVERYIRSTNPEKRIILLLNKMDLVPREVGERWLKYFREELPTVAFKCSTQQQAANMGQKKMPKAKSAEDGLQGSACLGADTLLQMLKNYCRNLGIKTSITVGVVGLPNVGKSSLINSLKRARVAQVGNTPGVTKAVQEIQLDKHIKLLDSPGVVFSAADSNAAAVLRNCIKVEKLEDPVSPIGEILKRVPAKQLMALYKIGAYEGPEQFLQKVAEARGKLRKGGVPNMVAAARIVLQDWNDGRIPYYTSPPSRGNEEHASAAVVQSWAKEFNAEEVFANEASAVIAHLPSMEDDEKDFFQMESAGTAQVDLSAMEDDNDDGQAEAGSLPGNKDDDEEDAMDASDDEYGTPAAKRPANGSRASPDQQSLLYSEEGQLNPHAARAARKKAKKEAKKSPNVPKTPASASKGSSQRAQEDEGDEEGDSDFDFDALVDAGSELEESEGSGHDDDDEDGGSGNEDGSEDGMED